MLERFGIISDIFATAGIFVVFVAGAIEENIEDYHWRRRLTREQLEEAEQERLHEMNIWWGLAGPWETAENQHRAELTKLERDEMIAEWISVTEVSLQSAT
jgi:hypothetical protein